MKNTAHVAVIPSGNKINDFHSAIVNDDFSLCAKLLASDPSLARIAYGRFPVLSLLYMYGSRKILRKIGATFKKTDYVEVDEYPMDYVRFRELSGRSLRLFSEGYVAPEDMLAVIGDAPTLRSALEKSPSREQAKKVAKIYALSNNGQVKMKGDKAIIPHSKRMNALQIVAVILIIIFPLVFCGGALGAYLSLPTLFGGDGSPSAPIFISNSEQFALAASDKANRYFTLKEDITLLTSELNDVTLGADISGENHIVKVDGKLNGPLFKEISGSLKNLTIDLGEMDFSFSSDSSLIAENVSGTVSNVKIIAKGKITDVSGNETVKFGCLTAKNSGTISNVELDLKLEIVGASASGTTSEDVFFGGIAAINTGSVSHCFTTADSEIKLDTTDGAAIVADNMEEGRVLDCTNNADITQTTSYYHWSPNTGGVVLNNYGTMNNCINNGNVLCSSQVTKEQYEENSTEGNKDSRTIVYAGGVVCNNYGTLTHCKNTGDVSGTSAYSFVYAGGIAAQHSSSATVSAMINNCVSSGKLTASSEDEDADEPSVNIFAGGIAAIVLDYVFGYNSLNASVISNCFSLMSYSHSGYEFSFFGAITGRHNIYTIMGISNYSFPNYFTNYYLSGNGFMGGIGCIYNTGAYESFFDRTTYVSNADINNNGTASLTEEDLLSKENYW